MHPEKNLESLQKQILARDNACCLITGRPDTTEYNIITEDRWTSNLSPRPHTSICTIAPVIPFEKLTSKPGHGLRAEYDTILQILKKHSPPLHTKLKTLSANVQEWYSSRNLLAIDLIVSGYFQSLELWLNHKETTSSSPSLFTPAKVYDTYTVEILSPHVTSQLQYVVTSGREITILRTGESPSPELFAIHAFCCRVLVINREWEAERRMHRIDEYVFGEKRAESLVTEMEMDKAIGEEVGRLKKLLEKLGGGIGGRYGITV
ncbi:hypothetical protein TWF788_004685 [Orbilia oligospora]|uniref:Uncharacterized protein n=1 Tax=Orbilia oligospora TaxID=2813651 RepID=A0A6G1M9A6_ORBOL|nr:hypothetical protein TWF788_004685 [Orbilia oligospora]KAF3230854.1 hypothetical protein TWF191_008695 [Orbilia oligospora]KAF3250237.1 hypothetical protein TWF192_005258 [Orbilia oligospora]